MSGNILPNPGPLTSLKCLPTPSDFKNRTGLGLIHLNVRSLLPKVDMIKIWINSTNADIMVLSETWLKKSIADDVISIDGYKLYRTDREGRGGGVAIYVNTKFSSSVTL